MVEQPPSFPSVCMLFYWGVLPWRMGHSFKALDICLDPLPSAAVQVALCRGHVDVGVGFVDRAIDVGAVCLLKIYESYISE